MGGGTKTQGARRLDRTEAEPVFGKSRTEESAGQTVHSSRRSGLRNPGPARVTECVRAILCHERIFVAGDGACSCPAATDRPAAGPRLHDHEPSELAVYTGR